MAAKLLPCRHTDDMIHKLESAGLGYHVKTDQSEDRLGMKQFVLISFTSTVKKKFDFMVVSLTK